jgi:hypothetical protein
MRIRVPKSSQVQPQDSSIASPMLDAVGYDPHEVANPPMLPPPSAAADLEAFLGRPPDKVNHTQIHGILQRLRVRLGEASREAEALGLVFDGPLVHEILDHLLTETRQPGHTPFNDGSVRAWFIDGLFADLIQYPSNIFEIVTAVDGTQTYLPLTPEAWAVCLAKLKNSLQPK